MCLGSGAWEGDVGYGWDGRERGERVSGGGCCKLQHSKRVS